MRKLVRIVIIILALAGLASGGYWYYTSRVASAGSTTDDGTYTEVVEVTQGSLSSSLSVVGSLEAVQTADLAFTEMSGAARLLGLEVQTGQEVAAGQVLASIDAAPYEQALDEAKNDLQAAEQALEDLQTPPSALSIAQAEVAVAAAQQTLEQARADLAELQDPDLASLEEAVQDAQDNLDLLDLDSELAERDSLAQTERNLSYTVAWYELHIAQLEELVARNEANLEQMETLSSNKEALAEAQANLARVQAERELARQARAAQLAESREALAKAKEALADAKAGGDALDLAKAELAVHEAEVNLEAAQEDRAELEEAADANDVAAAQSTIEKQRLAVADAEEVLAGTELVAPFAGTILDVYVGDGDPVGASTSIATLADLSSFEVVTTVDETTIRQVSAGQDAAISFDAYPDQTFTGQVLSVPLYGTLQGGVTVYDVPVSLVGAESLNLLVGMTANVEIQVGQATDALLVPTMALTRASGGYQVLVPNTVDPEGEPEAVPVQVGLSDGTYTQVIKGLNAGDQVLVELDASSSDDGFPGGNGGVFSGIFGFMRRR
jgi:HlyD family secretion protein